MNNDFFEYTTGNVTSRLRIVGGQLNWIANTEDVRGFWPALWLDASYDTEYVDVPKDGEGIPDEFDILEGNTGDRPFQVSYDVHCEKFYSNHDKTLCVKGFNDWLSLLYHVGLNDYAYSLFWERKSTYDRLYMSYISQIIPTSSRTVKSGKFKDHFDKPMYAIMNTNIPNEFYWCSNPYGAVTDCEAENFVSGNYPVNNASLPQEFQIDMFEIKQYLDCAKIIAMFNQRLDRYEPNVYTAGSIYVYDYPGSHPLAGHEKQVSTKDNLLLTASKEVVISGRFSAINQDYPTSSDRDVVFEVNIVPCPSGKTDELWYENDTTYTEDAETEPAPDTLLSVSMTDFWRLYPNPSPDGRFTLEHGGATGVSTVQLDVLNLQGQQLLHQESSSERTVLDLSTWPAGMYLIRVASPGEQHVFQVVSGKQ